MKILHISDTHGCHHELVLRSSLSAKDIDDTDILITHTPTFGILDFDDNINYGSEELLGRIAVLQPRLHLEF